MIYRILAVLLVHTLADFALQTEAQAKNKSSSLKALSCHVLTYTMCMCFTFSVLFYDFRLGLIAGLANGISHFAIDFVTSKINKKLYMEDRQHDFFVCIGFDQFIHIFLLLFTLIKIG